MPLAWMVKNGMMTMKLLVMQFYQVLQYTLQLWEISSTDHTNGNAYTSYEMNFFQIQEGTHHGRGYMQATVIAHI